MTFSRDKAGPDGLETSGRPEPDGAETYGAAETGPVSVKTSVIREDDTLQLTLLQQLTALRLSSPLFCLTCTLFLFVCALPDEHLFILLPQQNSKHYQRQLPPWF